MKRFDIMKKQDDESRKSGEQRHPLVNSSDGQSQFLSFKYSYKSMSSAGGKTHVRAKNQRFENGRFESEEFEGTLDGDMYEEAMKESVNMFQEVQDMFFNQMPSCFKPLSFLGTSSDKDKGKKE